MNNSLDPKGVPDAFGPEVVLRNYERRRTLLQQARRYQRLLDVLGGEADLAALSGVDVVVVSATVPSETTTALDAVVGRLDDIVARLASIEAEMPRRISLASVAIDEPDVETPDFESADASDEGCVIDLPDFLRNDLVVDASTLRSLADLDDEEPVEQQGPAETILHGIAIPTEKIEGTFDVLGVQCPGHEVELVQRIVAEAKEAFDAGRSKAPYYKWRRSVWNAAQAFWAGSAEVSSAQTTTTGSAAKVVEPQPTATDAAAGPRKLPANQEVRRLVAALMADRFPRGATISEIMEALQPDYDVRGKNPNYWWLLLSEGPFDLDQSNGRWTLAA